MIQLYLTVLYLLLHYLRFECAYFLPSCLPLFVSIDTTSQLPVRETQTGAVKENFVLFINVIFNSGNDQGVNTIQCWLLAGIVTRKFSLVPFNVIFFAAPPFSLIVALFFKPV